MGDNIDMSLDDFISKEGIGRRGGRGGGGGGGRRGGRGGSRGGRGSGAGGGPMRRRGKFWESIIYDYARFIIVCRVFRKLADIVLSASTSWAPI